ncbi:hypothetical protein BCV72DRAFT_223861 [Rhizopus microsporus var. microsporus]|uniref:Tc1-like transposase DDE domain-containing protein n=1 Tax=Rhizopus microsporus var. microsporus TaxID=86635 RepID=A0A1X0RAV2_RHIZD|nr:hypothetical protein BCV72DRAFT_223861 [Rhizopus microsporus var. microsporus]
MSVMDKNGMKGHYIVIDNASIHKLKVIRRVIEERDYKCLYLPPYSPFLYSIEAFWSKLKVSVRKTPLNANNRLTDYICWSVGKVHLFVYFLV